MKPIFKPEDFESIMSEAGCVYDLNYHQTIKIAEQANAKLQALIEAAPTVYGTDNPLIENTMSPFSSVLSTHDKYKARLMFIEELPAKECAKHELDMTYLITPTYTFVGVAKCKHCGVELKVKWEAVK